ncbi:MAG: hypothetical protein ACTII7_03815 [Galactobacter sp.]
MSEHEVPGPGASGAPNVGLRPDLLALSPDSLAALANRGLVK